MVGAKANAPKKLRSPPKKGNITATSIVSAEQFIGTSYNASVTSSRSYELNSVEYDTKTDSDDIGAGGRSAHRRIRNGLCIEEVVMA